MTRVPRLGILVCLGSLPLTNCGGPTAPSLACGQTHEFGNLGCAEVDGRVVDQQQRPLAGVSVGPHYVALGHRAFTGIYVTSDSAGQFSFRVSEMVRDQSMAGPDTVTAYVVAESDPRQQRPLALDSTLVVLRVTPVGMIPTPTAVTITLAAP
jgi:hypothetical protein